MKAFILALAATISTLLLWPFPAFAVPITYTDSFTASGTLGGAGFTNADVTVTVQADTRDVSTPGLRFR